MHSYEMQYTRESSRELGCYRFRADGLADALVLARDKLRLERGRLLEDDRPICSLELKDGTGVWLVGGPSIVDEEHRL